jgi:hypothetical protein
MAAENYDDKFVLHIQSQLDKAIRNADFVESLNTVLQNLQGQDLDVPLLRWSTKQRLFRRSASRPLPILWEKLGQTTTP